MDDGGDCNSKDIDDMKRFNGKHDYVGLMMDTDNDIDGHG